MEIDGLLRRRARRVAIGIIPLTETTRSWFGTARCKVADSGSATVSAVHPVGDRLVVQPVRPVGRTIRNVFIGAVLILALPVVIATMLPSGSTGPAVSAAPPLAAISPSATSAVSSGCGSRGGPGYRLSNGNCASWIDERAARQAVYDRYAKEQAAQPSSSSLSSSSSPSSSSSSLFSSSTSASSGCGSRGGPGYRLASGQCASWDDHRRGRH